MILNTIVWTAGLDVPEGGVKSKKVTVDEINANLDEKKEMKRINLPLASPDELIRPMVAQFQAAKKKKEASKKPKTKKKSQLKNKLPLRR